MKTPRITRLPFALLPLAGAASLVAAGAIAAPATRGPTSAPATQREDAADDVIDRLLPPATTRPAESGSTLAPPDLAGGQDLTSGDGELALAPDTRPQRLVPEGTYVLDRVGRVRASADGRSLEFIFAADGSTAVSAADPPMVLVPNLNLMALEVALREDGSRPFRITGRVTEYEGRNHLILEKVVVLR